MASQSWAELMAKAEVPTGGSSKLLPEGSYQCKILARKASKNTTSGKDRLAISLEVLSGPEKGEKFWDNWTVSPESPVALGIFFQNFERCGGSLDSLKMGGSLEAASASMVGQVLDVGLKVEEYPKGQTPPALRNKVSSYRKAGAITAPATGPAPLVSPGPITAPAPGLDGVPF